MFFGESGLFAILINLLFAGFAQTNTPRFLYGICNCLLAAHLAGISKERMQRMPMLFGHLLENFVVSELRKQIGWSSIRVSIYHFRTTAGKEVDILL
ncbi:MAG: hypothetical protein DHS20C01_22070 [marine bacterium B5-7]|nr:MAG: hypothetical protein DHS20C01_22070 [marine bacterium B5-7]